MESVDVLPANIVAEPEPVPESTPILSEPDLCLGKVNEVEADEMAPAPEKVIESESVSDSMEVDTSEPQSDSTLEPAPVLKTIDESAHESDGMAVDIEAAARVPTPVPLPGEDDDSAHEAAEEEASADCDASDAASGAPAVEASVESAVAAVEESNEMSTDQEAVKPEPVEHSTPDRPNATSQVRILARCPPPFFVLTDASIFHIRLRLNDPLEHQNRVPKISRLAVPRPNDARYVTLHGNPSMKEILTCG